MKRRISAAFGAFLALTILCARGGVAVADDTTPDEIVDRARYTVTKIAREQELRHTVPALLARAKAVMVFPMLLKGAFLVGGEGGTGVLLSRDEAGNWSSPAFYTLGALSFGLQIGGQASEAMLIIMTDRGLKSIIEDQVKLGGDLSVAVGPVGVGAAAATTTAFSADVYSYSVNQGLYLGGSLEGAVIARREDFNRYFYGPEASVEGIVLERRFHDPRGDGLRQALSEAEAR